MVHRHLVELLGWCLRTVVDQADLEALHKGQHLSIKIMNCTTALDMATDKRIGRPNHLEGSTQDLELLLLRLLKIVVACQRTSSIIVLSILWLLRLFHCVLHPSCTQAVV